MIIHSDDNPRNTPRRALLAGESMAGVGLILTLGFGQTARGDEPKRMLMFVQIAEDLKVDKAGQTIRLANVGKQSGATSLFIDWIGPGSGAGFGFHGVGVGFRDPGFR